MKKTYFLLNFVWIRKKMSGQSFLPAIKKLKLKRKMNQQRGQAGFPATPLQDSPISVIFVDNTKGGRLAKMFREEETRLGNMTGYNIRVAEMAGMALSRLLASTNPWGAEKTAQYATRVMKASRIARRGTYCMRAVAEFARWMEGKLERIEQKTATNGNTGRWSILR